MRPPLTASISALISAGSVELGIQIILHRRWRRFYAARHSEARASGPFCPCHARMPQAQGRSNLLALEGQPLAWLLRPTVYVTLNNSAWLRSTRERLDMKERQSSVLIVAAAPEDRAALRDALS